MQNKIEQEQQQQQPYAYVESVFSFFFSRAIVVCCGVCAAVRSGMYDLMGAF
jgi:hypothetical protein